MNQTSWAPITGINNGEIVRSRYASIGRAEDPVMPDRSFITDPEITLLSLRETLPLLFKQVEALGDFLNSEKSVAKKGRTPLSELRPILDPLKESLRGYQSLVEATRNLDVFATSDPVHSLFYFPEKQKNLNTTSPAIDQRAHLIAKKISGLISKFEGYSYRGDSERIQEIESDIDNCCRDIKRFQLNLQSVVVQPKTLETKQGDEKLFLPPVYAASVIPFVLDNMNQLINASQGFEEQLRRAAQPPLEGAPINLNVNERAIIADHKNAVGNPLVEAWERLFASGAKRIAIEYRVSESATQTFDIIPGKFSCYGQGHDCISLHCIRADILDQSQRIMTKELHPGRIVAIDTFFE